jgi:hypothetical protein
MNWNRKNNNEGEIKMIRTVYIFCLLWVCNLFSQQSEFPKLSGPYLGQTAPVNEPALFAPGIVSNGRNHSISYKDKSGNWLPAVLAVGGDRKSGGLSPIAIKLRSRNQEVAVAVAVAVVVFPAHCYCYCHSLKQQSRLT